VVVQASSLLFSATGWKPAPQWPLRQPERCYSSPMIDQMVELESRWNALWARLGISADRVPAADLLFRRYQSPERHYHNLAHVLDCLNEFSGVRPLCDDPDAVELAIWYHDAVYDPTRSDNEERSADLAFETMEALHIDLSLAGRVRDLILATKHTGSPATKDAQILIDIDLSILGRSWEEFQAYEDAIRREYAHVEEAAFRAGRAAILRRFLERPAIFVTAAMREKYEANARANLRRSIERLAGG
jgi:predicted metal-dependent HD superfamily phosphohydrolase